MKITSEEFELVLNNIAAAVVLYHDDGSTRYCNSYLSVLTGYSFEELESPVSRDLLEGIILREDQDRFARAKKICALGEDSLVRFRIRHKSGLTLWLETRMVPIYNTRDAKYSVMSISIDVTETLQYQKQIEEQNQDLNDFAYMVSHDLKAPIFTIQGMADALREDHGSVLGQEGLSLLQYISSAAQRLTTLVSSVLEYSALTNSDETLEEVPLSEIIPNVISDFTEQMRHIDANIHIQEPLPIIKGEPVRIYQLFSNLIGNAIKYRSKERSLSIEITATQTSPTQTMVQIKDNGLGIPANKLEDIFRPYRRAHGGDIEGSGIGLACVKKIVDKTGGRISVTSEEGTGSTFTLTLPLSRPGERKAPRDLERLF
jgi:PAS domain S-box-containing protein